MLNVNNIDKFEYKISHNFPVPYPGIEPRSPAFQADVLTSEPSGKPLILCRGILLRKYSF